MTDINISLSEVIDLMKRCESDDPMFAAARDEVCKAAEMFRSGIRSPVAPRQSSHEHLIWRDPFAPHNFKPVDAPKKSGRAA